MANNTLLGLIAQGYDPAARELQMNQLQIQRNQLAEQPEERAWKKETRGFEREKRMQELARRPFKDHAEAISTLIEESDMIQYEGLDKAREWFIRHDPSGILEKSLPSKSYFETTGFKGLKGEGAYKAWKAENIPAAKRSLEEFKAQTERINATKGTKATEVDILSRPDTDKEKIAYIAGKKALQEGKGLTEVEVLSLPDTDTRKIAYIKGKNQLRDKEPYFEALGIVTDPDTGKTEVIGYDRRTFKQRREPVPGMPVKPGTIKSVNPVQEAIANAIKESQGGEIKPGKTKPGLEGMPSPSQHKGRTLKDTTTGKRYKSDGTKWVEIK